MILIFKEGEFRIRYNPVDKYAYIEIKTDLGGYEPFYTYRYGDEIEPKWFKTDRYILTVGNALIRMFLENQATSPSYAPEQP